MIIPGWLLSVCVRGLPTLQQHALGVLGGFSLLFTAEEYPLVCYTTFCLSVHQWMSCFYFLALMNSASMNIHAQGFVCTYVFIFLGRQKWNCWLKW